MKNLNFIPGLYKFKNPYTNKGVIPFLVDSNKDVCTLEYRGITPKLIDSKYKNPSETISSCKMELVCKIEDISKTTDNEVKRLIKRLRNARYN